MIEWRKWVDPTIYRPSDSFEEPTEEDMFPEMDARPYPPDDDDDDDDDDLPPDFRMVTEVRRSHPDLAPSKHWNIWVAHTTQIVNEEVVEAILNTPGVEAFEVNSPYRFHVAIGQAFDENIVKRIIEKLFIIRSGISPTLSSLAAHRFPYHAMVLMSDGTQEVVGGQTQAEVIERVEFYVREKGAEEARYSWE